jgi:hypothetical protein
MQPGSKSVWTRLALSRTVVLGSVLLFAGCGGGPSSAGPPSTEPYVLFAPINSNVTYLMDLQGQLVHEWRSDTTPGCSVYLLNDGRLLRPRSLGDTHFPGGGCNGGRIELLDWDGNALWTFDYNSADHQQHHDVRFMPNGHVLLVAWEKRTAAEALAAGRAAATIPANGEIWVDHVVEVDPATNAIVWTWRIWDHLLPPGGNAADHPELIDPNAWATPTSDWTHANAIDYNADLDQVMLSLRNHHEILVIDHGTTTAEAAGHSGGRRGKGGDLIYRWGNPQNYGYPDFQQLFGQHNAHWIEARLPGAGEVLVFDNGDRNTRPYSTVVQIATPLQQSGLYTLDPATGFLPNAPSWQWTASPPTSVFATIVSSAQRLPSGDTLVCDGPAGHFFEVTVPGDTVWSYLVTDTNGKNGVLVFRATRYEAGYPALDGKSLLPQGPVKVELVPATAGVKPPAV